MTDPILTDHEARRRADKRAARDRVIAARADDVRSIAEFALASRDEATRAAIRKVLAETYAVSPDLRDVLRPYLEALATDSTAPVAATTTTTAPVAATKPAAHGAKANPPHSGQAITEDQLARMSGREAAAFFKRGGRVA